MVYALAGLAFLVGPDVPADTPTAMRVCLSIMVLSGGVLALSELRGLR
jgi:hypothetical protein